MSTRIVTTVSALALVLLLSACSSSGGGGGSRAVSGGGGYYLDDGPPAGDASRLRLVPDAVPRVEPLASGPNKPYTVMGQSFVPDTSERPYRKRGIASWYGKKFHGRPTSSGEPYDMYTMTAAHPTLPIPSYARVTRTSDGRSVVVRVNDRGPFLHGRLIDVSYAAAHRLGLVGPGSAEVVVERIMPADIRAGTWKGGGTEMVQTTPSPQTVAASLPSKSTFLQLGAFREEGNALALAHQAAARIDASVPVEVDESDPSIYRVRVGPYSDRQAAEAAIDSVYESLGILPTITFPD